MSVNNQSWTNTLTLGFFGGANSPAAKANNSAVRKFCSDNSILLTAIGTTGAILGGQKALNSDAFRNSSNAVLTKVSELHPKLAGLKPAQTEGQAVFTIQKGWLYNSTEQVGTLKGGSFTPVGK